MSGMARPRRKPGPRRAVVLLSGGLDSSTVLAVALRRGFEAHCLSVSYGQRHRHELRQAARVAAALGAASHRVVKVDLSAFGGSALTDPAIAVPKRRAAAEMAVSIPATYVPARNTVMLSLALAWAEVLGASDIFLGVNAVDYSGYPDCRPEFLEAFQRLARRATRAGVQGARIRIHAPLVRLTKAGIVRLGTRLGVPFARTLSCYDPVGVRACGTCDSCQIRRRGFEEAGVPDPTLYRRSPKETSRWRRSSGSTRARRTPRSSTRSTR
jgi:7-cyano-7-deazaguanine synthase